MSTQQALEILAEAINKAVACNLHSKAEIVGLQAALNALNEKLKVNE